MKHIVVVDLPLLFDVVDLLLMQVTVTPTRGAKVDPAEAGLGCHSAVESLTGTPMSFSLLEASFRRTLRLAAIVWEKKFQRVWSDLQAGFVAHHHQCGCAPLDFTSSEHGMLQPIVSLCSLPTVAHLSISM